MTNELSANSKVIPINDALLVLKTMQQRFYISFYKKKNKLSRQRADYSLNLRLRDVALIDQLEQLVNKHGHDAEHELKPEFFSPTNHHLAIPKTFFSPVVEALGNGPLHVAQRLTEGAEG